jgi:RNA-splicing ligase RtcB
MGYTELPGARVPIRMWADPAEVEDVALRQLHNVTTLPWVRGLAVMPDVHYGKGATVGSVIAMEGAVCPAAVGVDIGCGMSAVRTSLTADDLPDDLSRLRSRIERAIPVGRGMHDDPVNPARLHGFPTAGWDDFWSRFEGVAQAVVFRRERAARQMGSLGSGNHFVEVCTDTEGTVWLMLHSGSRNIGKELAEHHIGEAQKLPHNQGLVDRDLAVFVAHTPQMAAYRHDLFWAQEYARHNRAVMMALLQDVVRREFTTARPRFGEVISCFAGETEVLTRQGARPIRDLAGGRHELLTTGGEWVKAPVESFGEQRLYEVVLGRFGEEKVIRATAEHRWLLRPKVKHNRSETTTRELRVGDRLDYAYPPRNSSLMVAPSGIARGFVFGDGTISGRGRASAMFYGDKDLAMLPFFDAGSGALRTYYYQYDSVRRSKEHVRPAEVTTERLASGEVKSYRRLSGLPREWKTEYPSLDTAGDELYGWLAGYFAADGEVGKTGRPAIWSANREHLEFFKAACDALGIWTLPIRTRMGQGFAQEATAMYVMGISRADLTPDFFLHEEHRTRWAANRNAVERRGWTVREVRRTNTIEEVFCAVVDNTHAFTLADNILTGNCHHNYVAEERYEGMDLLVTRKGAIRAGAGDYGIIPGSMGTGSYIVKGLGNAASYQSASHGAGRRMSRAAAKRRFTVDDLAEQTDGVECRKDAGVIDEIPSAYKPIEQVIDRQQDLVEVVAALKQVVCVKG